VLAQVDRLAFAKRPHVVIEQFGAGGERTGRGIRSGGEQEEGDDECLHGCTSRACCTLLLHPSPDHIK
jgi:hypothetical protein